MIHSIMALDVVRDLQRDGRLRAVLADLPIIDDDTGEEVHFMMDMPIDQKQVEGPHGYAVVFYQEGLGDYEEGDNDMGNVGWV